MDIKLSLQELQRVELELLEVFHNFCEQNHLTYYLTAGTLLGAVRHNGFIPWDDDVDVLMPRPDYEKFLELFEQKNTCSHLKLATPTNTPNYYTPMAKLVDSRFSMEEPHLRLPCPLGPWIDIFPLDNMGDDYKTAWRLYHRVGIWRKIRPWRLLPPSSRGIRYALRRCVTAVLDLVPSASFLNQINKASRRYESSAFTKYVCVVSFPGYGLKEIMESSIYQTRQLHQFEGKQFYIPAGWKEILTRFYGADYMTPRKLARIHFEL